MSDPVENPATCTAYRSWLLRQARIEADSGCERILSIKSHVSRYFLDVTTGWAPEDRYALMCGRIKRMAWRGLEPLELTATEAEAASEFEWPALTRPTSGLFELGERAARGEFKLDKAALKRALKSALRPVLGSASSFYGFRFHSTVDGRVVHTDVDFGSKGGKQFRYWHDLLEPAEEPPTKTLLSRATFLNILGVYDAPWTWLTNDEVETAAAVLARLCRDFVHAVPELVAGAMT